MKSWVPKKHRKRSKKRKIIVTQADGTNYVVGPGHFQKSRKARQKPKPRHWYLRTPHWQKIRKEALRRDGHRCVDCCGQERLEVHHLTYKRVGSERLKDLVTLCRTCHEAEHERRAARTSTAGKAQSLSNELEPISGRRSSRSTNESGITG